MGHRLPDTVHGLLALSAAGIANFAIYLLTALVLTALYLAIFVRVTPYNEIQLIRAGNAAAATSLSGALLGFAIPLATAIIESVSFLDMLLWGVIALLVQLLVFAAACRVMPRLTQDIPQGSTAEGILLASLHVAVGLLNAACMTY